MYMNRKGIVFGVKDTWSLDSTLSPIILSGLKKFYEVVTSKEHQEWRGVPGKVLTDLLPHHEGEYTEEQLALADKKWLEILEKMMYAFDQKNEPNISKYNFEFKFPIGTGVTNEEEYERYNKDSDEHQKKAQEGFELFGKYFTSLWW